jgi:hypothetical protein
MRLLHRALAYVLSTGPSVLSPGACVSVTQVDLVGAMHIVLIHQLLTRLPCGDEGARVDDSAHKSCPT